MANPWEKYQQQPQQGSARPWERYAQPQQQQQNPLSSHVQQGMSGVNEGLANTLGFPVDLINGAIGMGMSGVNALAGTNFQPSQQPFLGSDSIQSMMGGAIAPDSDVGTEQFTRRIGKELGAALPIGLGMSGMTAQPMRSLATEMGIAGAGGLGAATANQLLPNNDMADLVGSLIGSGAGMAMPNAMRRIATPNPSNANREAMAQALMDEGVDLTAGQRSGNRGLRYAESELGGARAANLTDTQGEQFTRAALSRAGISADRATPEVLKNAYSEFGDRFDDMVSNTTVVIDPQFQNDLVSAVRQYTDTVGDSMQAPIIPNIINDITSMIDKRGSNSLSGESYQALRSRLGNVASGSADPQLKSALMDIQHVLDDAAERTLAITNPDKLGDWRQLRGDYRNFLVLERAASGAGEAASSGIISPAQLANAAKAITGRRSYVQGNNELSQLARSGVGIMAPLPDSGSASRLNARGLFTALGAGAGGVTGDIPSALIGAAVGQAVPNVLGGLALSPMGRSYLGNQRFMPQQMPIGAMTPAAGAMIANQGLTDEQMLRMRGLN